ncbi:MAG: phenylacetate--CoA ligase [Deferribacterota bacterium]|nr:phenylacetate--CoA ligase [Deferribacterota bacterium]
MINNFLSLDNIKYWDEKKEKVSHDELKGLQLERIRYNLAYVYNRVPFYKKLFDENSIDITAVNNFEQFRNIPFTTKKDIEEYYPYGFFAVPLKSIVRIHSTSGTTGKPTVVGYTRSDIELWKDLIARIITFGGVTSDDIVQIAFNYGLFTGGFGLHYGAEHIGATVIPTSSGNSKRQVMIMKDYRTTALVCTPSYALHLTEVIDEMGIKKGELALKYALLGGESFTENSRNRLEERLNIIATDNYGLSEVMGPGVAGECIFRQGLHINEDHFYAEIIDPDTGEVLPEGATGELVITTLTKEGMPLIRYRTRDITKLYYDHCPCGRTFIKMDKPVGRTDDMFIVNGVNVYPSQIEEVIYDLRLINDNYMIYLKKKGYLDVFELHIEVNENIFYDEMKKQKELIDNLTDAIIKVIGVKPVIKLVSPKSIKRFEGKAKRVVDLRNP